MTDQPILKPPRKQLHIYADEAILRKLSELAAKHHRTMSAEVQALIEAAHQTENFSERNEQ